MLTLILAALLSVTPISAQDPLDNLPGCYQACVDLSLPENTPNVCPFGQEPAAGCINIRRDEFKGHLTDIVIAYELAVIECITKNGG